MSLKNQLKIIVLITLSVFSLFIARFDAYAQQEYKIRASADKTRATVGDRVILTVTISSNSGISAQPSQPDFKDFDVMGTSTSSRISINNGAQSMEMNYIYALRPVKTGKITIGEFVINYTDAQNVQRQAKSAPIVLDVVEEEKKEDPAPTMNEEKSPKESPANEKNQIVSNFMVVATAVVILVFASIWIIMWQSARRAREREKMQNKMMAAKADKLHINITKTEEEHRSAAGDKSTAKEQGPYDPGRALLRIESLGREGGYREMYSEIPRFIKTGLGNACGCDFLDLSTADLLDRVSKTSGLTGHVPALAELLELCDMVNYAKYSPESSEVTSSLQSVRAISHIFKRGVDTRNEQ